MKKRLAKKIMDRIFYFKNWDSNYLPYSREQQMKAVKIYFKILDTRNRDWCMENIPIYKVPLKFRKYKGFLPNGFERYESNRY